MERRTDQRTRTLKAGKIIFNHRSSVINCTIRNLSHGGACLQVTTLVGIPDQFDLTIEPEHSTHGCTVMWKSGTRLGVAFNDKQPTRPATPDIAA
jgi:PilZ domain-containing protein